VQRVLKALMRLRLRTWELLQLLLLR